VENLNAKLTQLEKMKLKLQDELNEMAVQLDQAQILNAAMEKKAKQFDRIVAEWKAKVDSLSMDLDVSQKETRNASSELFRIKNAYDESVLQLDEVRREKGGEQGGHCCRRQRAHEEGPAEQVRRR